MCVSVCVSRPENISISRARCLARTRDRQFIIWSVLGDVSWHASPPRHPLVDGVDPRSIPTRIARHIEGMISELSSEAGVWPPEIR